MAAAVERTDSGPYREVRWQREDLREIEYASVLHDFGKIGVREHVLVKAKKLFPHEVGLIQQRFEFVIRTLELEIVQRKMQAMGRGAGVPGGGNDLGDVRVLGEAPGEGVFPPPGPQNQHFHAAMLPYGVVLYPVARAGQNPTGKGVSSIGRSKDSGR